MKKYILAFLFIFILFGTANIVQAETPSGAANYQYKRVLKHGSGGNDVVSAKYCLGTINSDFSDMDGYFSSRTKARVIDFQKKHDLLADGIIGVQTGAAMERACNPIFQENRDFIKKVKNGEISFRVYTSFGIKNSTDKKIYLDGFSSLTFTINGEEINGQDFLDMSDVDIEIKSKNDGTELRSGKKFSIPAQTKVSFSVLINKGYTMKDLGTKYEVFVINIDWE